MRILCYAQHLSGVGDFLRMHALACELVKAHEVVLVEGGRPVPRLHSQPGLKVLQLPRLHRRRGGALAVLDEDRPLAEVREERTRLLARAISEAPPDVLTIEHYPWSKWELEEEILTTIAAARQAQPGVRVACSLRDVAPQTRHEPVGDREYERRVLERLAGHFDALLVHSDPRFSQLEEHFPNVRRLSIPWAYTGFVCTAEARADASVGTDLPPYAVLSAGGGARSLPFLLAAIEAFRQLSSRDELGSMPLLVFAGPFMEKAALDALRGETRGPIALLPFSPEFPAWLRWSALSISQAGYNTCADLMSTRVPAVLVPDPMMSDQLFRAERMRTHGLATVVLGEPPPVDKLVDAIRKTRVEPRPRHDFGLRGAEETRALLERLHQLGTLGDIGRPIAYV